MADPETIRKAQEDALRLLHIRPRSRAELHHRLARQSYPEEVIAAVLATLERWHLVDDRDFAAAWVRSRTTQQRAGRQRLQRELRQQGIAAEIIEETLAAHLDEEAERDLARAVAARSLRRLQRLDEETARRRLVGLLSRRGFPSDLIRQIVRETLPGGEERADEPSEEGTYGA